MPELIRFSARRPREDLNRVKGWVLLDFLVGKKVGAVGFSKLKASGFVKIINVINASQEILPELKLPRNLPSGGLSTETTKQFPKMNLFCP